MRLTTYLNLTVAHLVPIEGLFAYVAMEMPEYVSSLQYINYMYLCFVALHGVHYFHKRLLIVRKVMEALQKPRPCEACNGRGLQPDIGGSYQCPECGGKGEIIYTEAQIERKLDDWIDGIPRVIAGAQKVEAWWNENEPKVRGLMAVVSEIDLTKVTEAVKRAKPELDRIAAPAPPPPDDFNPLHEIPFTPWCGVVDCRCSGFESSPSCGILVCGKCGHTKMSHKGGLP